MMYRLRHPHLSHITACIASPDNLLQRPRQMPLETFLQFK